MNGQTLDKINLLLGGLLFFSLLLFPYLTIGSGLPAFQLVDFLLPIITIALFIQRKQLKWELVYKVIIGFILYILFVILYNGRQNIVQDYFEIYKLVKFLLIILLFTLINFKQFFDYWLKPTFVLVVLGNLIHYFNLLEINPILEKYYDGGIHIQLFGLNSLGLPDMKRMVGFSGNPNINSLVFGFFTVLFFPKINKSPAQYGWFFLATFMFFLCQSRTNFIALVLIAIFVFFWNRNQVRFNLTTVGILLGSFIISFFVSTNSYINLLFEKKIVHNSSLLGRFETWKYLWEMIKEKPIFGHAPYKEYFYERDLYAENEFILQAWRYGILGLIAFLTTLLIPLYSALKNKRSNYSFELILFIMLILVNCLTNTPFANPTVNVLLAILLGLYYGELKSKVSS